MSAFIVLLASPWVTMYRRLPLAGWAGVANVAHLGAGVLVLVAATVLAWMVGRDRPWPTRLGVRAGGSGSIGGELGGLARGRLPVSEGSALFALIQLLLLLSAGLAAASGLVWLAHAGTDTAMLWADVHRWFATAFCALIALHLVAFAAHLRDFVA